MYWEQPAAALEIAVGCQENARLLRCDHLLSRALTLQGAVSLHLGDLRGAFALAAGAERIAGDDAAAQAELAALNTHLHFFSGSYGDSLRCATEAVQRADATGDVPLRLHARRMACLAFGNLGVDGLEERFDEVLALARAVDSPWEQAIAHNDLAHLSMTRGEHAAAEAHLDRGEALALKADPTNFVCGVLDATRSELRLSAGKPEEALAFARRSVSHVVAAARDANPYLLGMAILTEVNALLALDRVEAARDVGEQALERLGERVPQAGSMILSAVAAALRDAGRAEEAYDTLARAAELEREAMREFSQLNVGLERARLEAEASQRQADVLSAKNTQLEALLSELADAQDQLRDQADRDWLTGVRNRRYLARAGGGLEGSTGLAVVDLDHFKSINDRFGHQVGDEVLVRVAQLLVEHVRDQDVVARTGGEEFAVLMPRCSERDAAACSERLRAVIADEPWDRVAQGLHVTASIGVATAPGADGIRDLERVADERLYAAKRGGRDRVVRGPALPAAA